MTNQHLYICLTCGGFYPKEEIFNQQCIWCRLSNPKERKIIAIDINTYNIGCGFDNKGTSYLITNPNDRLREEHYYRKLANFFLGNFDTVLIGHWNRNNDQFISAVNKHKNHKKIIRVNEYNTTKKCSYCGFIAAEKIPTGIRTWICPRCKIRLDRDINAARNILSMYSYCPELTRSITIDQNQHRIRITPRP